MYNFRDPLIQKGQLVKLAVNYSEPMATLLRNGEAELDLFKCPAWPETLAQAQTLRPSYAHLPLTIQGDGKVTNSEAKAEVDWEALDRTLAGTQTRHINLHPDMNAPALQHIPADGLEPEHVEQVTDLMIGCVMVAVERYGAEKVTVENIYDLNGTGRRALMLPETYHRILDATGAGFLLDISHARLAASQLGRDPKAYINELPVERLQEVHVTGIRLFDDAFCAHLASLGIPDSFIDRFRGQPLDHMAFTDADWEFLEWAFQRLHNNDWQQPWIVSMEYGGVGPVWEDLAEIDLLRVQIPRLYSLVHGLPIEA